MPVQTLLSLRALRHPVIDHLRVLLTGYEPGLVHRGPTRPGARYLRGRLTIPAMDDGNPLELKKLRYKRSGRKIETHRVTRIVDVNGYATLQDYGIAQPTPYGTSGQINFIPVEAWLCEGVERTDLSRLCVDLLWGEIEAQRQHARWLLKSSFPEANFVRLCFQRSIKEIELSWDIPVNRSLSYDGLLEVLHWTFPGSAIRGCHDQWQVVVQAPLADLKFYLKEDPKGSPHVLLRCEAVIRNYRTGVTPRYRRQIARILSRRRQQTQDPSLPTGVRFASAEQLDSRVRALADFVAQYYPTPLCRHSLNHTATDRINATCLVMANAMEAFRPATITKVRDLMIRYSGHIPVAMVHWKLKRRLIASETLIPRKWGRRSYLTTGRAVDRHLGILGAEGVDTPNPSPILDASKVTGWEHRVGLGINIA